MYIQYIRMLSINEYYKTYTMLTFASGRLSIAPVIFLFSWRFPVLKNRISIKPSTSLSGDHHAYRWLGRVNWSHFLCNSTPILRHVINFSKMTTTSCLLSFTIEILSTVSFLHMVSKCRNRGWEKFSGCHSLHTTLLWTSAAHVITIMWSWYHAEFCMSPSNIVSWSDKSGWGLKN